jgi:putative CocE/NonD family hydrolase
MSIFRSGCLLSCFVATFALSFAVPMATSQAPSQAPAPKPAPFDVRAHYAKTEYHVAMRDGVKLYTIVYAPKDASRTYPFLVTRTCYSVAPYGADTYRPSLGPSRAFAESGYIFVYQDVRGRFGSEGSWEEMTPHIDHPTGTQHDESTDMYDTVEWLLKHVPHNNGKVGIYGISYPGFYTSASIIDGHPAIKAASPQAPVTDLHDNDDAYHNGAFLLEANDFYLTFRPQPKPTLEPAREILRTPKAAANAYEEYLAQWEPLAKSKEFVNNPLYSDQVDHPDAGPYWDERDISRHLHNIHAAVLTVGGWFDAEDLSGPHKTFQAIAKQSPETENRLVIGPWVHGGWSVLDGERIGEVHFGSNTGEYFRDKLQFPFFEHYLKDAPMPEMAKATVFETGSNVWKSYSAWPPEGSKAKMLYFLPGGKLGFAPPASTAQREAAYDEYVSDPAHPVPEVSFAAESGPTRDYMVADQRFASERPDVLVYQTDVLNDDVTFAGPLRAKLHVSTSGTDSDFVVKLIDVYPQAEPPAAPRGSAPRPTDVLAPPPLLPGYEQLVRGEPMRGKFRKSPYKPEPFTPGKVEALDFSLVQVNHTFLKGHRIMVQVQSSWFPLVDLNPQTFVEIPKAKPEDFRPATERVYHTAEEPSGIEFQAIQ